MIFSCVSLFDVFTIQFLLKYCEGPIVYKKRNSQNTLTTPAL